MVKQKRKQTILSDVTGIKQTVSPVVLRYPDATVPSGKCQVYVLHVISPVELYVQLEEEGVADPGVELSCTINKLYGSLSETEMILEDPEVGISCCVNEGCQWYKSVVCDNTDAGKLVVKYVDNGSIVTIDRQRLKQLDDALCRLTPLAIQCCLAELMTSLAAIYSRPDSDKLVVVDPKRGVKCCLRSSTDEQWYRAVIDSLEDGTAAVTFKDFVTWETVMTEELRYIRPFLRQAPFAIHCCVAGLDSNAEGTPDENDVFVKKT